VTHLGRPLAIGLIAAALAATAGLVSAAAEGSYQPPKTEWGDPDLQGLWTNASITTLERQPGMTKSVVTPQEAAVIEARTKAWLNADSAPSDVSAGAPQAGQDPGGYNSFWIDLGSKLAVVNGQIRTSWIVDPPDGKVPYSAEGRRQIAAIFAGRTTSFDNPESRSLGERCIVGYGSTGGPPMLNVLYNNNYQIVQSPGYVTIVVEMNHDARIIRLGGTHPPPSVRPWMGDSIGHWEGDTLVVETSNLNPGQRFTADVRHRLYLAPDSKVTERFTRIGKDEILYQFSVEEPTAYTQTWRGEIPMRAAKGPMYEYACHEGNYALPGILRGARAQEQKSQPPKREARNAATR
jgi:hypothetical protein